MLVPAGNSLAWAHAFRDAALLPDAAWREMAAAIRKPACHAECARAHLELLG